MALAGGVFARSYVARDSGAAGYVYASSTRLIGAVDDALFLSCGTARIPGMDDLWEQPDYANAAAAMWFYRLF
jgi:hypothetical protein